MNYIISIKIVNNWDMIMKKEIILELLHFMFNNVLA